MYSTSGKYTYAKTLTKNTTTEVSFLDSYVASTSKKYKMQQEI